MSFALRQPVPVRSEAERIELPYDFTPREYQREILARMDQGCKLMYLVWHRRAGKDKLCWQIMVREAWQRQGLYLYLFPKKTQAKSVVWKGRGKEGVAFLEHIPKALIESKNEGDMEITLKNGSIIRVGGAKDPDSWRGNNALGFILSEYADMQPGLYNEVVQPMLVENDGWCIFNTTPKGKNHAYRMWVMATKEDEDDDWFTSLKTIEDTFDLEGNRIISEAKWRRILKTTPKPTAMAEYMCSWDGFVLGSYFTDEVSAMIDEDRIHVIPVDSNRPVITGWDLGVNDSTAIVFAQVVGLEIRIVDCYQDQGHGLQFYVDYIRNWAIKHKACYSRHFAPHDISVREMTTGVTRHEAAKNMGLRFKAVRKPSLKIHSITALRNMLPRTRVAGGMNGPAEDVITAITEYSREQDDDENFLDKPKKTPRSHMVDAMMTLASGLKIGKRVESSEMRLQSRPLETVASGDMFGFQKIKPDGTVVMDKRMNAPPPAHIEWDSL